MRLLTFISSVCLGVTCLVAGTESECALDALIESLEAHQTEGDWVNPQTISRIRRLDSLSRVEQQSPVCGDFDRWQTDTRKAAVLFLSLSKHFAEEDHDKLLALDLIEGSFNTLSAIKLRLQSAFDAFEWYDRLTNMLPFIQSRTALSHGQTTLLAMVSETLGKTQGKAVKEKAWTLAGRLLDEMDFKIADYGAVKSGFHSILIIYKQIEIYRAISSDTPWRSGRYQIFFEKNHEEGSGETGKTPGTAGGDSRQAEGVCRVYGVWCIIFLDGQGPCLRGDRRCIDSDGVV